MEVIERNESLLMSVPTAAGKTVVAYNALMKTVKEGNDKGNWYGWEISREDQLQDTNYYSMAKTFAESVGKGEVKVKYEQESATNEQATPF